MADLNIIDRCLEEFSTYIDSGFGLVRGQVGGLSNILVSIDMTLAALFWSLEQESDVLTRLVRKILFVGAFALIINNFQRLAQIVFSSFAQLGLRAGAATMSQDDLVRPGRLASLGFNAAQPLLDQAASQLGFPEFFGNFVTIAVLLLAWVLVILAFFILAIQLFVTVLEFKLTTLAGFVLTPFALWNKTAFMAERVLGGVVSSGVKVMVLAIIVGIGSGFFQTFVAQPAAGEVDLVEALSLVLAAGAVFGLGIFGPSIASGLVTGGPQLGAGAAANTALAAAGILGSVRALAMVAGGGGVAAATGAMSALQAATRVTPSAASQSSAGLHGSPGPDTRRSSGEKGAAGRQQGSSAADGEGQAAKDDQTRAAPRPMRSSARSEPGLGQALQQGESGANGPSPKLDEDGADQ